MPLFFRQDFTVFDCFDSLLRILRKIQKWAFILAKLKVSSKFSSDLKRSFIRDFMIKKTKSKWGYIYMDCLRTKLLQQAYIVYLSRGLSLATVTAVKDLYSSLLQCNHNHDDELKKTKIKNNNNNFTLKTLVSLSSPSHAGRRFHLNIPSLELCVPFGLSKSPLAILASRDTKNSR